MKETTITSKEIREIEKLIHFAEGATILPHLDSEINETILHLKSLIEKNKDQEPQEFIFTASILFNKGLGNQVKETPQFKAGSLAEAQETARKLADQLIGEEKWKEVKIRPVNPG